MLNVNNQQTRNPKIKKDEITHYPSSFETKKEQINQPIAIIHDPDSQNGSEMIEVIIHKTPSFQAKKECKQKSMRGMEKGMKDGNEEQMCANSKRTLMKYGLITFILILLVVACIFGTKFYFEHFKSEVEVYRDGSKYVGNLKDGKRHGKGKLFDKNGDIIYDGQWKNGKRDGQGIYLYGNDEKYDGQWKNGERDGHGVMYYSNGDKYDGNWENDKRDGDGIMKFSNGRRYEGEWIRGKMNGNGTYSYANGEKYVGNWRNGDRNGHGVMYYANNQKYDGNWVNDKRHGDGIMKFSNYRRYKGKWKDNLRHGHGIMKFSDGRTYEGEWNNGTRDGKCTWKKGQQKQVRWRDDVVGGQ